MHAKPLRLAVCAAALVGLAAVGEASAASIIKSPNPPQYGVEIEPHLVVTDHLYGGYTYDSTGFGPGLRFSIPVMSPGFVKTINDSIAIGFGADLLHFSGYRCGHNNCVNTDSFWVLYAPVVMQWNFWLTEKWSVFGEPGLVVRHAFVDSGFCNDAFYNNCRNVNGIEPAFFAGGRFHFGETTALTMRLGFPMAFSIGVSFF